MNVRELRKKAGLTQEDLSAVTGIPRGRIAKWEQGQGNPKKEDFDILEKVFKDKKVWEEVPRATILNEDKMPYNTIL